MSSDLKWYINKNKKSLGPYSLSDMHQQIAQGILMGNDLVFQEGAHEWKPAYDWPEFSSNLFSQERASFTKLFQVPETTQANENKGIWVVLKKIDEPDGLKFKQTGPHSTDEVRKMLRQKDILPSDHIWRSGYKGWVAIFSEAEFSPSLWNVSQQNISDLKATVEMPQPVVHAPVRPIIKEEVQAAAVFASQEIIKPESSLIKESNKSSLSSDYQQINQVEAAPVFSKSRNSFVTSVVIGCVAFFLVVFVGKKIINKSDEVNSPTLQPTSEAAPQVMSAEAQQTVEAESQLSNQIRLSQEVSQEPEIPEANEDLPKIQNEKKRFNVKKNSQPEMAPSAAEIWSLNVARNDIKYTVLISGSSGKILQYPALVIRTAMRANQTGKIQISPQAMHLPEGNYQIYIYDGKTMVSQTEKKNMREPKAFSIKLAEHRKKIAYMQQQERRRVVAAADGLQNFMQKNSSLFLSTKVTSMQKKSLLKGFQKTFSPEFQVIKNERHQLVYANAWYGLAQQYDKIGEWVQSVGLRRPASKEDLSLNKKRVGQIRNQALQTSLFAD